VGWALPSEAGDGGSKQAIGWLFGISPFVFLVSVPLRQASISSSDRDVSTVKTRWRDAAYNDKLFLAILFAVFN